MERQEKTMPELDDALKNLFEQAHRDPALKRELLHEPAAVAERFGVKLSDDDVHQLQKLGAVADLAEEIKYGRLYPRPPIFYPIDVWRVNELVDIFSHLIPGNITYPGPGPIFYPAPNVGAGATFAMRAYNPGWVTYPGDEGAGKVAGSLGRRIVIGPIFYPPALLNFFKERLTQILQIRQHLNR